jgi:hypothetical protein
MGGNNGPKSTYGNTSNGATSIKDEERKTFESIMKRANTGKVEEEADPLNSTTASSIN